MKLRTLSLFAFALLCATTLAQSGKTQTVSSHPLDTKAFFPQIQQAVSNRPFKVSQGPLLPDRTGAPNKLEAGGTFGVSQVLPSANFPGISQTGWTPGDPDLAVGIGHIVEVINSQIGFFTKSGVKTFQQSATTFFAGMGAFNFQFDPKVSYDRVNDRFVLIFLERDTTAGNVSKVLVAVSDDGDPNGVWYRYRVEAKLTIGGNEYWMDYPGLGYNKDAYVVNGNMFPFGSGGFGGVQFLVMPSAPMLSGGAVSVTSLRHSSGASAQVADVIDPTQPNVFAVSRNSSTSMRVYAIQNLTTSPTFVTTTVGVPSNSGPAGDAESTNGRTLDVIDARVYNAVWRGGRLLTAHNIEGTSFVASRWYEINTGNWPSSGGISLVQSGNIDSNSYNAFCPAINKNSTGKVSMLFTRSSTNITADFMVASRRSGDPLGTLGSPVLMMSSVGNNYSQGRWGDYFCIDVDPVDDVTFWGVHMLVASNNSWWTEILSWTVPGVTQHAPSTYSWFRGVPVSGNLGSLASDDGNELVGRAGLVLFPNEPPAQLENEVVAPSSVVYGIDVLVRARVNTPGLVQRIEIWNYTTNAWDVVGQQAASVVETPHTLSVSGNMANYVQPGTRRVKVKTSWLRSGLTLVWPWTVSVDQVQVSINGA